MARSEAGTAERIARAAVYDMLEAGMSLVDVIILVEEAMQAFLDAGGHSEGDRWRMNCALASISTLLDEATSSEQ